MLIMNFMNFNQIVKKIHHHIINSYFQIMIGHEESLCFVMILAIFIIINKNLTLKCLINEIIDQNPLSRIILACSVLNNLILFG